MYAEMIFPSQRFFVANYSFAFQHCWWWDWCVSRDHGLRFGPSSFVLQIVRLSVPSPTLGVSWSRSRIIGSGTSSRYRMLRVGVITLAFFHVSVCTVVLGAPRMGETKHLTCRAKKVFNGGSIIAISREVIHHSTDALLELNNAEVPQILL